MKKIIEGDQCHVLSSPIYCINIVDNARLLSTLNINTYSQELYIYVMFTSVFIKSLYSNYSLCDESSCL